MRTGQTSFKLTSFINFLELLRELVTFHNFPHPLLVFEFYPCIHGMGHTEGNRIKVTQIRINMQ